MDNRKRLLHVLMLSAGLGLLGLSTACAAEFYEGLWAKTPEECGNTDRPTSKTMIDLINVIDGKASPIFDQYENHCKIERVDQSANGAVAMTATCFEFWDDYSAERDGRMTSIKIVRKSDQMISIDGLGYRRCKKIRGQP